jgi:hypothetical protein
VSPSKSDLSATKLDQTAFAQEGPAEPTELKLYRQFIYGPHYIDEIVAQITPATVTSAGVPIDSHVRYVLQDANYNVTGLVRACDAKVIRQYRYEPYGQFTAVEGLDTSAYSMDPITDSPWYEQLYETFQGFQGRWHDAETITDNPAGNSAGTSVDLTGGYVFGVRDYGPHYARFNQRDPNEQGLMLVNVLASNGQTRTAFASIDPAMQYADGLSLYQFVGSNPLTNRDPSGMSFEEDVDDIAAAYYADRIAAQIEIVMQAQVLFKKAARMAQEIAQRMALESAASAVWQPAPYAFAAYDTGMALYAMYQHGASWGGIGGIAASLYGAKASVGAGTGIRLSKDAFKLHLTKRKLQYRTRSVASGASAKFRGGSYSAVRGGGTRGHQMPSKGAWEAAGKGGAANRAPAIQLEPGDHVDTASWGRISGADAYRKKQADLIRQGRWREALLMDINDIRHKFGDKYDLAILEALEYAESFKP